MDDKAGTSEPLKIIITITTPMKEWLKTGTLELDWNFPQDEDHAGLTQALSEHQQIGGWQKPHKPNMDRSYTAK